MRGVSLVSSDGSASFVGNFVNDSSEEVEYSPKETRNGPLFIFSELPPWLSIYWVVGSSRNGKPDSKTIHIHRCHSTGSEYLWLAIQFRRQIVYLNGVCRGKLHIHYVRESIRRGGSFSLRKAGHIGTALLWPLSQTHLKDSLKFWKTLIPSRWWFLSRKSSKTLLHVQLCFQGPHQYIKWCLNWAISHKYTSTTNISIHCINRGNIRGHQYNLQYPIPILMPSYQTENIRMSHNWSSIKSSEKENLL